MNLEPRNPNFLDDLDWLAFCYVNDELTGRELEAFETRLLDDSAAQDAVERAVHQQLLIAAAWDRSPTGTIDSVVSSVQAQNPATEVEPHRRSSGRRIALAPWFAAAAAILLVALGLWSQYEQWFSISNPSQLATQAGADVLGDEWLVDEDYASQLADALVDVGNEADPNPQGGATEQAPITLRDDWMLDVFVEFGDDLDSIIQEKDSQTKPSETEQSWG